MDLLENLSSSYLWRVCFTFVSSKSLRVEFSLTIWKKQMLGSLHISRCLDLERLHLGLAKCCFLKFGTALNNQYPSATFFSAYSHLDLCEYLYQTLHSVAFYLTFRNLSTPYWFLRLSQNRNKAGLSNSWIVHIS